MRNSTITGILFPDLATQATACSAPSKGRDTQMSMDLKYLLLSVLLAFVQVLIAAAAANREVGLETLAGNREGMAALTGFAGRARRAHLNMIENIVLFTALVLVTAVAGHAHPMPALGALLFFWATLLYAVIFPLRSH